MLTTAATLALSKHLDGFTDTAIPLSNKVKIHGVMLDPNLTMELHTKALSKSCFYHICTFRQIRSYLGDLIVFNSGVSTTQLIRKY